MNSIKQDEFDVDSVIVPPLWLNVPATLSEQTPLVVPKFKIPPDIANAPALIVLPVPEVDNASVPDVPVLDIVNVPAIFIVLDDKAKFVIVLPWLVQFQVKFPNVELVSPLGPVVAVIPEITTFELALYVAVGIVPPEVCK